MTLSVMGLSAIPQFPDPSETPDNGALFNQWSDDQEIVEVTVGQMRNALWYYNNYFIVKQMTKEQAEIIAAQRQLTVDAAKTVEDMLNKNEQLQFYKNTWWVAVGIAATAITTMILGKE